MLRQPAQEGEKPLQQIRKFCLECVGGSPDLVKHCTGFQCPLWSLRFGTPAATVRRKSPELWTPSWKGGPFMKLYVACSSNHLREARQAMNALHKAGHEVTGDWIEDFVRGEFRGGRALCVDAIDRAESVVFIPTSTVSRGLV